MSLISSPGMELSIAKTQLPLPAKQQTDKSTNKAQEIIFTADNKLICSPTQIVIVLICLSVFKHFVLFLIESFINTSCLSLSFYYPFL